MTIEDVIQFTTEEVNTFINRDASKYYVFRKNINTNAFQDGGAYFGFIRPEEDPSGQYHDFCIVLFPGDEEGETPWILSLGVGTLGFQNDYDLAAKPGFRRLFQSIISENGFCKTDFLDLDSPLPNSFLEKVPHLSDTLDRYKNVLPVCEILDDIESEESKDIIRAFIAIYARARDWLTNNTRREYFANAVQKLQKEESVNHASAIKNLLLQRKYVILTGPPGVGKTRLAKIIGNDLDAQVFFTQFHAETNYSDFIYGIIPDLDAAGLKYSHKIGTFHQALDFARKNPDKTTLLIVDEINRANLSNILGPIFYLFEYLMDENTHAPTIEISPKLSVKQLPDNFYMVGTMNTADRSLAVVDFALRRRFAWYELLPSIIPDNNYFFEEDFLKFHNIFYWYADSNELTLQPGQGYFLAEDEEAFLNRVEYELFPLIKEYLQEQLLVSAKEEFNDYFLNRITKPLFQ